MKYKIFFMIPSLAGGGAERVFANLVKGIDKQKFDVTLIYLSDERNVYELPDDIKIINLNTNRVRKAPLKILKIIRNEEPHLIVSTHSHLNIMLLILKKLFSDKTKVIIRQTNIMSLNKSKNTFGIILQKHLVKLYKKADKVICQSEYMKKDIIKITGINEKKVEKIYNPIDIEAVIEKSNQDIEYEFHANEKKIFFLGRLNEVKRIPLIIEAFKKYQYQNINSKLYILGDGPKKQEIQEYLKENNLSNKVKLLGFQRNPYNLLKCADLFLLASKHEGMPNALIEALALQVPVLVLKHPGGTVDVMDILGLKKRFVDKLIINEKAFNNYDEILAPQVIEHFGIENIMKKYESLFLTVLEKE